MQLTESRNSRMNKARIVVESTGHKLTIFMLCDAKSMSIMEIYDPNGPSTITVMSRQEAEMIFAIIDTLRKAPDDDEEAVFAITEIRSIFRVV